MLTYRSVSISEFSLLKYGWGDTRTYIIKSPGGPPAPELPFLETLKLTPLSTPLGILIVSFTVECVTPLPLQVPHGSLITEPTPSQLPHTYYIINGPYLID